MKGRGLVILSLLDLKLPVILVVYSAERARENNSVRQVCPDWSTFMNTDSSVVTAIQACKAKSLFK